MRIKSDRERKIERRRQTWIAERARELLRAGSGARCNCGGPSMGTDHSPDCEHVQALDGTYLTAEDSVHDQIAEARGWLIVRDYDRLVRIAATAPAEARESVQRAAAQYYDIMDDDAQLAADEILLEMIEELGKDPLELTS